MTFEWQFRCTGGRGVSEYGSIGVLEYWSVGVLGCWGVGVLGCWSVGVMGRWGEDGEYQHVLFRDGSVFQHSVRTESRTRISRNIRLPRRNGSPRRDFL